MRTALLAPLVLPALAGCDAGLDQWLDWMSGRERNVVVLARQPVTLPRQAMTLSSAEPMKVLGRDWTSLCFALKGDMALGDSNAMDRAFREAIQDARIQVHVTLADGQRVALGRPSQSWSRYGKIFARDELAACASAACGTSLPLGAHITQVEVSANPPLRVQGIYWRSEQGLAEAAESAPQGKMAQTPTAGTSCSRAAL